LAWSSAIFLSGRGPLGDEDPDARRTSQSLCQLYVSEESTILSMTARRIARFEGARVIKFVQCSGEYSALHNIAAAVFSSDRPVVQAIFAWRCHLAHGLNEAPRRGKAAAALR
jgi:hypothetical protein